MIDSTALGKALLLLGVGAVAFYFLVKFLEAYLDTD